MTVVANFFPPPPPAASAQQQQSSDAKKNFAPFSGAHDVVTQNDDHYNGEEEDYEEEPEEQSQNTNGTNRYSVEHLKPLLPDGKRFSYGPIVRELKGDKGDPMTPAEPQPEKEKKQLLASRNNSTGPNNNNNSRLFSLSGDVSSIGEVHALADPPQLTTPQTNSNQIPPNLNSPEFELFKNELEKTKQQILERSKENQLVLAFLKTNNGNSPNGGITLMLLRKIKELKLMILLGKRTILKRKIVFLCLKVRKISLHIFLPLFLTLLPFLFCFT